MFVEKCKNNRNKEDSENNRNSRSDGNHERNKYNAINGSRVWNVWRKSKKWCVMLTISLFVNCCVTYANETLLQQGIAEEVLRFHVLANSDSEADQAVKLKVRDAVIKWIYNERQSIEENEVYSNEYRKMSENSDENALAIKKTCDTSGENTEKYEYKISYHDMAKQNMVKKTEISEEKTINSEVSEKTEIEQFLKSNLNNLESVANTILIEEGVPYRASAAIESCYFPDRTYGDYTFPSGWYQALRIRLGEAKGQNWWCVLYPKLCFSDCLHATFPEDQNETLEEILTVEEYDTLLQEPKKWRISFRWFGS